MLNLPLVLPTVISEIVFSDGEQKQIEPCDISMKDIKNRYFICHVGELSIPGTCELLQLTAKRDCGTG